MELRSRIPSRGTDRSPSKLDRAVADFGLWIGEPFQGRGYSGEVVRLLLVEGFTVLGLDAIEATVFVGNEASRRAMERNAMHLDATLADALIKRGRPVDPWRFTISREEWERARVRQ